MVGFSCPLVVTMSNYNYTQYVKLAIIAIGIISVLNIQNNILMLDH